MKRVLISLAASFLLLACGSAQDQDSQTSASSFTLNPRVVIAKDLSKFITCQETVAPEIAAAEQAIFTATNAERQRNGLRALVLDPCASQVARRHSQNMANRNQMEHVIDGKGPIERLRAAGVPFSAAYENIHNQYENWNGGPVYNFGAYPGRAMGFWTTSPTHRANVLRADVTHIGIGVAKAQHGINGYITGTQNFLKR